MSGPDQNRAGILALSVALAVALALAGCGEDESSEGNPGTLRVAVAVAKSFLSNFVEATETEPESTPLPPESPPMPLASFEPEVPETCEIPYSGPITIIPVRNAAALARSVADRPIRELVYETEDTAIFEGGRVLTLNMENLGTHLNAVGWSTNPIKIMGAGVRPGGSSLNTGWNSAENTQNTGKKRKKKRRRRG